MRKNIQGRQMDLLTKITERDRILRRYERKKVELNEAKHKRDRLEEQLTKEQQDVVKLGKFSFMNKIREFTGKLDILLEKEIQEAVEAELKWNEAEKTFVDLTAEVAELKAQRNHPDYFDLDEKWEDFLVEKERWLRVHDSDVTEKLSALAEKRSIRQSLLHEVDEAIVAGQHALKTLRKANSELKSAQGMSTWDTFLGGGILVTAMKYSHINASDDLIHYAQRALRNFQTELADVQNMNVKELTINQKDLLTFADYFFDNMFLDWMVHSKINNTKSQIVRLLSDVSMTVTELQKQKEVTLKEIDYLEQEEQKLLLS